jgi:hypothetical protein
MKKICVYCWNWGVCGCGCSTGHCAVKEDSTEALDAACNEFKEDYDASLRFAEGDVQREQTLRHAPKED